MDRAKHTPVADVISESPSGNSIPQVEAVKVKVKGIDYFRTLFNPNDDCRRGTAALSGVIVFVRIRHRGFVVFAGQPGRKRRVRGIVVGCEVYVLAKLVELVEESKVGVLQEQGSVVQIRNGMFEAMAEQVSPSDRDNKDRSNGSLLLGHLARHKLLLAMEPDIWSCIGISTRASGLGAG